MSTEQLTAQIKARNLVNKYANELAPLLTKALTPFIGQKVIKADRSLTLKIKSILPDYVRPALRWHLSIDAGSISLKMDVSERYGDHSCLYQETYAFLFSFESYGGDILGKAYEHKMDYKTDYSLDTILAKRKELEEAEQKVRDIKTSLHPFI